MENQIETPRLIRWELCELNSLLEERDKAKAEVLQRKTRSKTLTLKTARNRLQQHTRERKSQEWEEKAEALQQAANRNDMNVCYNDLR